MWRMRDADDGEAAAVVSISTSVCQIWVTHEAFRCSPVCFQSARGCDLKANSILQHIKRNGSLLCQRKREKFGFLGANVSLRFKDSTQPNLPVRRPHGARFCHCRLFLRGNSLKDICHFHVSISAVCCVVFAVIGMAKHAGSRSYWGEGTANKRAKMIWRCVLNAALQKISSY